MILFLAHRASYSNSNARHSWDCASVPGLLKEDGFMPRSLPRTTERPVRKPRSDKNS